LVHLERFVIALVLLAIAFGSYFAIGAATDPSAAVSLETSLDERIPFVPETIFVYALVYVMIILPMFLVESRALFQRIVASYVLIVVVCLACFVLFPVSAAALRPPLDAVETHPFLLWGLRLNYALDPPVNLFPSLHLAGATIAALSVGKARRRDGLLAGAAVVPVAVSVCTVKQHFWLDAAAGIVLAFVAFGLVLWRFTPPPGERLARGPGAWLAFGAMLAGLYGSLYLAYRAGLEPWTW
jgi:hypothetical protein